MNLQNLEIMKLIKKIIIALLVLACWSQLAEAYNYFTINFNYGTSSDPFYTIEVDSIRYSKFDINNVEQSNWAVQEIWTANNVFRYPISDIEGISFAQGEKHNLPSGHLKVLAIGNSFVDGPMAYFDAIVRASGIDRDQLCVYSAVKSSASLEYWATTCENGDSVSISRRSGAITMPTTRAPLKELLEQDWDVVTVQQVSTLSQKPNSLSPYLSYLVNQIRKHCPNKDVVIAWQQVWSKWYEDTGMEKSLQDWENINSVVRITPGYGVDMIIPTGTAIQNARATELNTPHGLTRDGGHLAYGVGRYVAACTWFEALLAPVFGVSVVGNTAVHAITEAEQENSVYEAVSVTDENRTLCQQCAAAAVNSPFEVTEIVNNE